MMFNRNPYEYAGMPDAPIYTQRQLDVAIAAAVEAERERCAKLCEAQSIGIDAFAGIDYHVEVTRNQCAAAIRA